jgi:hypothetical protein
MVKIKTLRWYLVYDFYHINICQFIDNFKFDDEWSFIQYKHSNSIVSFGYMNRYPQITGKLSDLTIFHKYTTYKFDTTNNSGYVILSYNPNKLNIPSLQDINITHRNPYTNLCEFKFDFHCLMTILSTMDDVVILDKNINYTRSCILYNQLKIDIVENHLCYTGIKDQDIFIEFCKDLEIMYNNESKKYMDIFDKLKINNTSIKPSNTHLSLSYEVWYKGSRENQREWPNISIQKINPRSIEFPKDSNIYYTPLKDNQYVGLSLRHDDNALLYIPKLYTRDHREISSYLYDYINNTNTYILFQLSSAIKDTVKKYGKICKEYRDITLDDEGIYINYNGEIYLQDINPKVCIYKNKIIGIVNKTFETINFKVQLLDKESRRSMVLNSSTNEWESNPGNKIKGIPSLPYYYKSIIHDYNKMGRLRNGEYMDLTHIGIVDPNDEDIITFPLNPSIELYVGESLETHRLCTFKYKPYVYELRKIITNVIQ